MHTTMRKLQGSQPTGFRSRSVPEMIDRFPQSFTVFAPSRIATTQETGGERTEEAFVQSGRKDALQKRCPPERATCKCAAPRLESSGLTRSFNFVAPKGVQEGTERTGRFTPLPHNEQIPGRFLIRNRHHDDVGDAQV